jgi:hypothetical protein
MPPAPLVPPSALRSALTVVVVAAFLVLGMVAIPWVVRLDPAQWLAASVATAAMGGLTVRLATCSPVSAGASIGPTVGWSLLLGVVNVPVSFLAASLVCDVELHMFPMAAFATVIGAPFGLVLGLLFGLMLSMPVAAFMHARQRPSPDATDVALAVTGLWLALATGIAVLLASPMIEPEFPLWSGDLDPSRALVLYAIAWGLGGLGMALAAAAGLRCAARRRFIARVALGRVPAWRLSDAPPERTPLAHLPCLGATPTDCELLLLRCEQTGDGAYRRATTLWPVAWVPHTWLRGTAIIAPHE